VGLPVSVTLPVEPLDRIQSQWRVSLGHVCVPVLEQGPQVAPCRVREDEVGLVGRQEARVQLRQWGWRGGREGEFENVELGVEGLLLREGVDRVVRLCSWRWWSEGRVGEREMRGKPDLDMGELLTWRILNPKRRSVVLITHTLALPDWLSGLAVRLSWTLAAWPELDRVEMVEKSDSESDNPRSCSSAGSVTSAKQNRSASEHVRAQFRVAGDCARLTVPSCLDEGVVEQLSRERLGD
jgi:hypothetical protein